MVAPNLSITELTGSRRSVELRDRALPFRPMAVPVEQRHKKTIYPGNPVATIQLFGPDERGLEIGGTWKDRFIRAGNMVSLTGFEDLWTEGDEITVEILVEVFHRLVRGGNLIEFRWGPEVRQGIISRFEPNYQRLEDVGWKINFVWSQKGDRVPSTITEVDTTGSDLTDSLDLLDDTMSQIPPILLPFVSNQAQAIAEIIREETVLFLQRIAAIQGIPTILWEQWQGISSVCDGITEACKDMIREVSDQNMEVLIATSDVSSSLTMNAWRTDIHYHSSRVSSRAVILRESVRGRVVGDYVDVIVIRENQTLRTVAIQYYNNADDWTIIADANNLVTSNPPIGTKVYIPRGRAS